MSGQGDIDWQRCHPRAVDQDAGLVTQRHSDYCHSLLLDEKGRRVLADMLEDAGYLRIDLTVPEAVAATAVRNHANQMLRNLGLTSCRDLVEAICGHCLRTDPAPTGGQKPDLTQI